MDPDEAKKRIMDSNPELTVKTDTSNGQVSETNNFLIPGNTYNEAMTFSHVVKENSALIKSEYIGLGIGGVKPHEYVMAITRSLSYVSLDQAPATSDMSQALYEKYGRAVSSRLPDGVRNPGSMGAGYSYDLSGKLRLNVKPFTGPCPVSVTGEMTTQFSSQCGLSVTWLVSTGGAPKLAAGINVAIWNDQLQFKSLRERPADKAARQAALSSSAGQNKPKL